MIKEQDEQALLDTVILLEHESKLEGVSALVKMMVERTLALLRKPTDFLEDMPFVMPPLEVFHHFHRLDQEIRQSIRVKNPQRAHQLLVEYVDLLPWLTPSRGKEMEQVRKYIFANLLAASEPAVPVEERVEVYTSSEAAEIVGVSDQTIRRWCDKGKYPEAYQTEGGHWRIPKEYFKITLEQARKRKAFEQHLDEFNASKGEGDESEWL